MTRRQGDTVTTDLRKARVVLVRPALAANIGAVVRVMRNFGLTDLCLVQPHADPLSEAAKKLSTHGEAILHSARSVDSLGDAVSDCVLSVATSARLGGLFRQQNVGTPTGLMPRLVAELASGPAAMVFGPEATGLTSEEVSRCHFLLTIPADESYPVLNIAQAVAICLYELYQAVQAGSDQPPPLELATIEEQDRLFESLRQALTEIHFLWDERAPAQMHGIRHLLGRAQLSPMEVKLLHGVARQIQWYVKRHPPDSLTANEPESHGEPGA